MFHQARIKLTVWYLLIIMAISIAFSVVIFVGSTREFGRLLRTQQYRFTHPEFRLRSVNGNVFQFQPEISTPEPDPAVINEAKTRLLIELIGVNTVILLLSAIAGYFLAGLTLKPIQNMVNEQNRFVTDASHELNTPLTSLRTTIEVNLREKQLTQKKLKEILQSNLEEVTNLQNLITGLIEMTRVEQSTKHVVLTSVFIPQAVDMAIKAVTPQASKKHINIISSVNEISIKADLKSLTELFTVLLDNAVKYSSEGQEVTITSSQADKHIGISVTDQGIGIAKRDIPHIFDRFYRADKSRTKQNAPGYGLGLSIAKRIVGLYGGTIAVCSEENKGSTFTVVLPQT